MDDLDTWARLDRVASVEMRQAGGQAGGQAGEGFLSVIR
jgi:hypothetical protein